MPKLNAQDDEIMVDVPFQWITVAPDPVQYKPYNPTFSPLDVYVVVKVPERYVLTEVAGFSLKKGMTVLTPEGMAYASKELAKAISKGHNGDLK